jgi:hypothetical protein
MVHTLYQYALEILAEDGTVLGQVPVEPDWSPALEWASFQGIRQGRLPAVISSFAGTIEPVWDTERGEPHVSAFRAVIPTDGAEPVTSDFPTTYVRSLGKQASGTLVEKGLLKAGDLFRYRVCAFHATRPDQSPTGPDGLSLEEIISPLPLLATPLQPFLDASVREDGTSVDPAVGDDIPVFIPQHVLDEAVALSREAKDVEVGGIMVGRLHRDPDIGELFLEVTAQIPARHTRSEHAKLTFTADTWAAVDAAMRLRSRNNIKNEIKVGWWHHHPDFCRNCPPETRRRCVLSSGFFSAEDAHMHRVCFSSAYHIALLITSNMSAGLSWSFYGWRQGVVAARTARILGSAARRPASTTRKKRKLARTPGMEDTSHVAR